MNFVAAITLCLGAALSSPTFFNADAFVPMESRVLLWEYPGAYSEAPEPAPVTGRRLPPAEARIKESRLILEERGLEEAIKFLEKADDWELVLLRGEMRLRLGQLEAAERDFRKIIATDDRGRSRALALDGFHRTLHRRAEAGDAAAYGPILAYMREEWRNEEALDLIRRIEKSQLPAATRKIARDEEPIMALRLGRYDEAEKLLSPPDFSDQSRVRWLALCKLRRGDFKGAAELRLALAKRLPAGKSKAKELATAFGHLAKGGLYDEAKSFLKTYPGPPDAEWLLGLAALSAGRPAEAENHFVRILKTQKTGERARGARYFLGRALEMQKKNARAREEFALLAKGPFDYYRVLAQGRLGERRAFLAAEMAALLEPGPSGDERQSLAFHLWITEKSLGREDLPALAQKLAEGKNAGPLSDLAREAAFGSFRKAALELPFMAESALDAAWKKKRLDAAAWHSFLAGLAAQGGNYRLAVRFLHQIPGEGFGGLRRSGHPPAYGVLILRSAREHNLAPQLIMSVMRTESAYQPDIMSASNARGLMQLLPATADKIAAILGEPRPGALALFDPELNIRYGSWYLAVLADSLHSAPLALAAYNGGPYNIKSLLDAKKDMPLDVFIETLPVEETAKYVKRITESQYIYEEAYLGRANSPDFSVLVKPPKESLPAF